MSAQTLKQRLAAARAATVRVGDMTFDIDRPSRLDVHAEVELSGGSAKRGSFAIVVGALRGWDGVRERDVDPASTDESPAPFDRELARLWLADRQDIWSEIAAEIGRLMAAFDEQLAAAKKPSPPTSGSA